MRRRAHVSKLCAALHIPRCSYYKWLKREKNRNELLNEQIIDWIKALYIAQNGILGYRQMTIAINRTHQTQFNKKRIRRLMRALNLRSVCRKKRCSYTPSTPEVTAENILNREFHADKANEKWLTDVTEFKWYDGPAVQRYISAQFLISMTDELWHIKLAPATITSWYLIRSMKQLRRILMHILYSIVTVDSSIQVSTFGQSWTPQRWCRVCPELDGVLTMARWKDSGEF